MFEAGIQGLISKGHDSLLHKKTSSSIFFAFLRMNET